MMTYSQFGERGDILILVGTSAFLREFIHMKLCLRNIDDQAGSTIFGVLFPLWVRYVVV